jgi:predicted DNA-binding protein YlxM (UPF0122 family)
MGMTWEEAYRTWSLDEYWIGRRHTGIKYRAEEVARRLERPPVLPDWLLLLPDGILTKKQHEACEMVFGRGLSQREAADALDVSRNAIVKRLQRAEYKVRRHYAGLPLPHRGQPSAEERRTEAERDAETMRRIEEELAPPKEIGVLDNKGIGGGG